MTRKFIGQLNDYQRLSELVPEIDASWLRSEICVEHGYFLVFLDHSAIPHNNYFALYIVGCIELNNMNDVSEIYYA